MSADPKRPVDFIDDLYAVIESRRGADPSTSYVAKKLAKGTEKIAQKLGEEAVETVIAAVMRDRAQTISESADLLFHMLLVWADAGIEPAEVIAELDGRRGTSGLIEKKKREKD